MYTRIHNCISMIIACHSISIYTQRDALPKTTETVAKQQPHYYTSLYV